MTIYPVNKIKTRTREDSYCSRSLQILANLYTLGAWVLKVEHIQFQESRCYSISRGLSTLCSPVTQ